MLIVMAATEVTETNCYSSSSLLKTVAFGCYLIF